MTCITGQIAILKKAVKPVTQILTKGDGLICFVMLDHLRLSLCQTLSAAAPDSQSPFHARRRWWRQSRFDYRLDTVISRLPNRSVRRPPASIKIISGAQVSHCFVPAKDADRDRPTVPLSTDFHTD
jgi:hypothetical protein